MFDDIIPNRRTKPRLCLWYENGVKIKQFYDTLTDDEIRSLAATYSFSYHDVRISLSENYVVINITC